jgi:hypothetical protein
MAAILLLSCYFVAGNANLPLFIVFPVNFLFFLLNYLVYFERIKDVGDAQESEGTFQSS